jgi:hypothetical protein
MEMKMRISIGVLLLLLACAPSLLGDAALVNQNDSKVQQKLTLNTTILKSEYCSSPSDLVLTLRLLFTNEGREPILLQKKSSVISKYMIARTVREAASQNYVQEITPTLNLRAAGYTPNSTPELSHFAKLNVGESYATEHSVLIPVFEKDDLQPGKYLLQVRVVTWYYRYDWSERFREQWRQEGFLWTKNVTSTPMEFEVKRGQPIGPCEGNAQ